MNAQVKVRARRANTNTTPIGDHMTLIRVVNDPVSQKYFGFAVTDKGEEIYIPSSMVRNQQMTEHDVGAGFVAVLKTNAGFTNGQDNRICVPPIKWDGEIEEIEVEVAPEDAPITKDDLEAIEGDLRTLADEADNMCVDAANQLREAIADIDNLSIRDAKVKMGRVADALEGFRTTIDEIAPEVEEV